MKIVKRIILIRHLPTKHNKEIKTYMGRVIDASIAPSHNELIKFKSTLKLLNNTLGNGNVLIVTSPLKRCLETAEIIAKELRVGSISTNEKFIETNLGDLSTKTLKEIWERYPKIYEDWTKKPMKVEFPRGESYKKVQKRVLTGLKELLHLDNDTIILCSHVDIIKTIILAVLKTSFNHRSNMQIPPGSISSIVYSDLNKYHVEAINLGLALPESPFQK